MNLNTSLNAKFIFAIIDNFVAKMRQFENNGASNGAKKGCLMAIFGNTYWYMAPNVLGFLHIANRLKANHGAIGVEWSFF